MIRAAPLAALVLLAGCGDTLPDPRGVDHDETLLALSASGEAEAAGKQISRVLAIRDGGQSGGGYPPPPYPMYESASDAMAPLQSLRRPRRPRSAPAPH